MRLIKNLLNIKNAVFTGLLFGALFFTSSANAAIPAVCQGLPWYGPTQADPAAGKCPANQKEIPQASAGCAQGEELLACGKKSLAANDPVFGCCAASYKMDSANKDNCTSIEKVECGLGTGGASVAEGGLFSYVCMDDASECTIGEVLPGMGSAVGCTGGLGVRVCCKMPVCSKDDVSALDQYDSATKAPSSYKLSNPLGTTSLTQIAQNVINVFLGIVGALALLVFIYGGISYIIAGGTEGKVQKAKDTLKYAVVGIFFIMFAYVITDTFILLWTSDLSKPTLSQPQEFLNQPTEAEQEVTSIKEQQDAAKKVETDAINQAKSSKSDVCGQTPATQGYSCMTLLPQEQVDYDCLSSYCQSNQSASYLCCKKK